MRRAVKVKQHDVTDCGAACLYSVAAYHGYRLPISRIRQYAATDEKGTNALGMVQAAERMGFAAKGVRGTFDSLYKIPLPAIAHVVLGGSLQHFVVISRVNRRHVTVMDPGDGRIHRLSHEQFEEQWSGVLILMLPGDQFQSGSEQVSPVKRFWQLVRPHRTVMTQALVGAAVYTLLGLSTSIYVQKIVDHVLVGGNHNLLNLMGVVMLVLLALQVIIGSAKSLFVLRTGQHIDAHLILGYYKHLMQLPQRFFDTMRVGEIISRVGDAVKIRAFINDVSLGLVVNVLVVCFSFGLMFCYAWQLALIMLAVIPLYSGVYYVTNRVNRTNQRRLMENAADMESQLVESLSAVRTVKQFGLEPFANVQTEVRFVRLLRTIYRSGTITIFARNGSLFASQLFTILLLWVGAGFVLERVMTPGELMSFYALLGYLTGPVNSLIGMNQTIQDALIAADRLFEIMDLEREGTRQDAVDLTPTMLGDLRFEHVYFRYGTRRQVFRDLNVNIPHGKTTALVGESGSGKSTLAALLQRMYPIEKGRIVLGTVNLDDVSRRSLRRLIGVVPQKVDLFSGSVLDNIAVGDFEPDMRKVLRLAELLGITRFVKEMPDGFHTPLGENGARLSGGQKQRIAIARALYREPEVLILDEATSSLDSAAEQYVQRAVSALRQEGKTVVLIAHRLSSVVRADKIVVLRDGRAVEQGTHRALLARRGDYFKLWQHQFPSRFEANSSYHVNSTAHRLPGGDGSDCPGVPSFQARQNGSGSS